MKILQLCKKFPWPLKDGESVAVNSISKGLAELGVTMDLLAMNTQKHFTAVDSEVIKSIPHYRIVKWVPMDTRISVFDAVRSLIEGSSYHLKRFINPGFANTLKEILEEGYYDFVILESLYMVPYTDIIRKHSQAKIIFRSHNLEFEIWDRLAYNSRNPLLKWYFRMLANNLKDYECAHLQDMQYLMPISPVDHKKYVKLGYRGDIFTLPLGLDLRRYPMNPPSISSKIEVGFIGSLDWRPNVEGLQWFLSNVWPSAQANHPHQFRLHIAGRNMPDKIRKQASPNIIIHGEVSDAIDFIQRYDYFVVPLFSGSGMRVKILEAMAMGKIVLSTGIGIEGIPAAPDKEFIRVDDKSQFLKTFDRMARNDYNIGILGRNARSFIEDNYSIKHISTELYHFLHEIHRRSLQKID